MPRRARSAVWSRVAREEQVVERRARHGGDVRYDATVESPPVERSDRNILPRWTSEDRTHSAPGRTAIRGLIPDIPLAGWIVPSHFLEAAALSF